MTITLTPIGDNASELLEVTCSSSALFPIPLSAPDLVTLLKAILSDPEKRIVGNGAVTADRMRDGIRISVGSGTFTIAYRDLFPIVMEA